MTKITPNFHTEIASFELEKGIAEKNLPLQSFTQGIGLDSERELIDYENQIHFELYLGGKGGSRAQLGTSARHHLPRRARAPSAAKG